MSVKRHSKISSGLIHATFHNLLPGKVMVQPSGPETHGKIDIRPRYVHVRDHATERWSNMKNRSGPRYPSLANIVLQEEAERALHKMTTSVNGEAFSTIDRSDLGIDAEDCPKLLFQS